MRKTSTNKTPCKRKKIYLKIKLLYVDLIFDVSSYCLCRIMDKCLNSTISMADAWACWGWGCTFCLTYCSYSRMGLIFWTLWIILAFRKLVLGFEENLYYCFPVLFLYFGHFQDLLLFLYGMLNDANVLISKIFYFIFSKPLCILVVVGKYTICVVGVCILLAIATFRFCILFFLFVCFSQSPPVIFSGLFLKKSFISFASLGSFFSWHQLNLYRYYCIWCNEHQ